MVHSGETIQLHVNAIFPIASPLTYYWTSQAGTLKGKGTDMIWQPKDAAPGNYTVQARVNDGHRHEAICSMQLDFVANLE